MTSNTDTDEWRNAAYDRLEWEHEPYRGFGDPDEAPDL